MSGTSPETSASDAAARVSLPLTMSNIFSLRPTFRVRRSFVSSPSGPAPFARGGDVCRFVSAVNHLFSPFSQVPQDPQNRPKKVACGPFGWTAKQRLQSAGSFRICPVAVVGNLEIRKTAIFLVIHSVLHSGSSACEPFGPGSAHPHREHVTLRNIARRSWPFGAAPSGGALIRRTAGRVHPLEAHPPATDWTSPEMPARSRVPKAAGLAQERIAPPRPASGPLPGDGGVRAGYTTGWQRLPHWPRPGGGRRGRQSRRRRAAGCRPPRASGGSADRSCG